MKCAQRLLLGFAWMIAFSVPSGAAPDCLPASIAEPADSSLLGGAFSHSPEMDPASLHASGRRPFSSPGGSVLEFDQADSLGSFPQALAPVPVRHGGYRSPGEAGVFGPGPIESLLQSLAAALEGRLIVRSQRPLPVLRRSLRLGGTVSNVVAALQHEMPGQLYLHWDPEVGALYAYPGARLRVLLPPQDLRYAPDRQSFAPGGPSDSSRLRTALDGAVAAAFLLRGESADSIEFAPPNAVFASVPVDPRVFVSRVRQRERGVRDVLFLDFYYFEADRLDDALRSVMQNDLILPTPDLDAWGSGGVQAQVLRINESARDAGPRLDRLSISLRRHAYMGRVAALLLSDSARVEGRGDSARSRPAPSASVMLRASGCVRYHALRPGTPVERSAWEQAYQEGWDRDGMSVRERAFTSYHPHIRLTGWGPGEVRRRSGLRFRLDFSTGGGVGVDAAFGDLVRVDFPGSFNGGIPDVDDRGLPGLAEPRIALLIRPRVRRVISPRP